MIDFPSSPANGQIVTGPNGTTWFWNGSAWRLGSSVPAGARGTIAYAQTITQQTGITSTLVDVAGLTVTFTAVAGRTYKVTAAAALGCTAIQPGSIRIYLDGAQVQNSLIAIPTGDNVPYRADCEYVTSALTAGSHTFKIMAGLIGATGTMTVLGNPLYPNFILVEDITYEAWSGGGSTPSSGVSLGNSVAQTIPNATNTAVTFDVEYYDTAGYHTTGSRITIPAGQDGRYLVGYTSSFYPVAGGTYRYGWIQRNGGASDRTAMSIGYGSASYAGQLSGTATVDLNAGDYIEHYVAHDQGASQPLQGNNSAGHLLEFYAIKLTGSGSGGGGGGSGFTYVTDTPPTPAKAGDTWFNSSTGALGGISYVAIDRGSGVLVWVQFSPGTQAASVQPWNTAWGRVGYNIFTQDQTGIGTTLTWTNSFVHPTFVAGRLYQLHVIQHVAQTVPSDVFVIQANIKGQSVLYQMTAQTGNSQIFHVTTNTYGNVTAGSGQLYVSLSRAAGTGTANCSSGSYHAAYMTLFDVGPITPI